MSVKVQGFNGPMGILQYIPLEPFINKGQVQGQHFKEDFSHSHDLRRFTDEMRKKQTCAIDGGFIEFISLWWLDTKHKHQHLCWGMYLCHVEFVLSYNTYWQ